MKVALYARYSSERQRDSSIADQFRNCERFLEEKGWAIAARYKDEAKSGATADRPGYRKMLEAARSQEFNVLVVDDLSRLSRCFGMRIWRRSIYRMRRHESNGA